MDLFYNLKMTVDDLDIKHNRYASDTDLNVMKQSIS